MLTAQMQESIDWWDEYGIKNRETDDVHPLFSEWLRRINQLPTEKEWCIFLSI